MPPINSPDIGPADHASVRLDYDTMRLVRDLSARRQVSISDIVREAVCNHVGTPAPAPRSTRPLDRLQRTDALIKAGAGIAEACAATGLDPATWYRHAKQIADDQLAAEVLGVLAAIRDTVARA